MTKTTRSTAKRPVSRPPHWLTRSEKLIFKRIAAERQSAGLSVSATVEAAIGDFAMARSRLRELRKLLAMAQSEVSERESDRTYVLSLFREVDRATRLSISLSGRASSKRS